MTDTAAALLTSLLAGLAASLCAHGLLWLAISAGLCRGRLDLPLALGLFRFAGLALGLWAAAQWGPASLLAALAGFLTGRQVAVAAIRFAP